MTYPVAYLILLIVFCALFCMYGVVDDCKSFAIVGFIVLYFMVFFVHFLAVFMAMS